MTFLRLLARKTATSLPALGLLALPATARAVELGVRAEPGIAVPLTAPQTPRFEPGGVISLKGYLGLGRYFDVQAGISFVGLPAAVGTVPATTGTAWSDSLGLRLKRPHDEDPGRGVWARASPWIDADALYVRTGGLDRFGVTVGAGVSFHLETRRNAWLGPFVRYMDIVQPRRQGFDSGDARVLLVGVGLEIGSRSRHRLALAFSPAPAQVDECPSCPILGASDRDHDGLSDAVDNCPDVAGPVENRGCPVYRRVIVRPDKLELSEKIMFAFDKADLEAESYPLLDEVVQALKDNKGFRVQIEGHTDSTGPREHNQTLSEQRALTVLAYLRDHGVASERLSYVGFGESAPTDSNQTVAGRENNRRVDFVVHFKILDRSAQ